jgi:hypothetical protein
MKSVNARPASLQANVAAGRTAGSVPSILATNLRTTTGWAVRTVRCRFVQSTAEFRPSRLEGRGMRHLRFGKRLDAILPLNTACDG